MKFQLFTQTQTFSKKYQTRPGDCHRARKYMIASCYLLLISFGKSHFVGDHHHRSCKRYLKLDWRHFSYIILKISNSPELVPIPDTSCRIILSRVFQVQYLWVSNCYCLLWEFFTVLFFQSCSYPFSFSSSSPL